MTGQMRRHLVVHALLAGAALMAAQSAALAQSPLLGPNLAPPPLEVPSATALNAALPPPHATDGRIGFSSTDSWRIPRYFELVREKQKRAARSKKFPRALPEGLTENPTKGERLPLAMLPGLERLPAPLLRELPASPAGTDRVLVGKNVLMVSTSTGEVFDILPNMLF